MIPLESSAAERAQRPPPARPRSFSVIATRADSNIAASSRPAGADSTTEKPPLLLTTHNVRAILAGMVESRTPVAVCSNGEFSQLLLIGIEGDHLHAATRQRLSGTVALAATPYHFATRVLDNHLVAGEGRTLLALPDRIVVSQRRRFPRQALRPERRIAFQREAARFALANLSMTGMETESTRMPFSEGAHLHHIQLALDEQPLLLDARICRIRRTRNGNYRTGFVFDQPSADTLLALSAILAREDLWESSDLITGT